METPERTERDAPNTPTLLRREVRLLGDLLGTVIAEAGGPALLSDVEVLRQAVIDLRDEESDVRAKRVLDLVGEYDLDRAETVARAFTVWFQLVNLAEEHHRVRDLRERGQSEDAITESIGAAVASVRDWEGDEELHVLLDGLEVTPVLTAHPTEARRRAVVEALERIAVQMARLDDTPLARSEEADVTRRLLEEIEILWNTDQLRAERPTPLDEVRGIMAMFDETIFRVAPMVYRELDRSLDPAGAGARPPAFQPFLRWGSWVGGDRDGNPSVDADVTRETMAIHAEHVLRGHEAVTRRIARAMSASAGETPADAALLAALETDEHVFPFKAEELEEKMPDAPHRRMMILIAARLEATREERPGAYATAEEFIGELRLVQRSLASGGAARTAYGELQHLVWQAETFGFHLASLEIRQHAAVHQQVLEELQPGVSTDPVALHKLATNGWPEGTIPLSPEGLEVLTTFATMHELQARYGTEACRRYVVSFTRSAADVVAVRALARLAVPDGTLALDVVPLFEGRKDLENAPAMLDELFDLKGSMAWLKSRGNRLEVMLGYSDSAKDVGFLSANFILYQAQAELAEWARRRGIILTLFHGRGGALGRGGGPTNRAIWAQAPGSVAGRFKVTEQGEVTFARYANTRIAQRHLEQVTNAVLLASTPTAEAAAVDRHSATASRMAEASQRAYRALVEQEGFADFFVRATPSDEIARLNIASRPARRKDGTRFEDLRAIPWVFAWSQSRCNLPGWFGLGSGLAEVAHDPGGIEELQAMLRDWPFFTSLMENAELSLVKADLAIAQLYFALGERPDLAKIIEDEFRLTENLVLKVTGHDRLLESQPRLQRDIALRNPYIDALSLLQVRLLRELRAGIVDPERANRASRLVQLTVNGIAAGLQNTG